MKPLGVVLATWDGGRGEPDPITWLRSRWPQIVGPEVAAHSRPLALEHGALLVLTRSAAWSHQLAFLNENILEALRRHEGCAVERLRFRVGRIAPSAPLPGRRPARERRPRRSDTPAGSLEEAFARFRTDVTAAERAKAAAGWKECSRCGTRFAPRPGTLCVGCENQCAQERAAGVARLLFEVPWLGYAGIAPLVDRLSFAEYQAIRRRLLARWWDVLATVRRTRRAGKRERMIASSYVLLKSELDPERLHPAVVRDLLSDELHDILYGTENS